MVFFSVQSICLPFRKSDPGSHSRHSSPLPTLKTECMPSLLSREGVRPFLPSPTTTRVEYFVSANAKKESSRCFDRFPLRYPKGVNKNRYTLLCQWSLSLLTGRYIFTGWSLARSSPFVSDLDRSIMWQGCCGPRLFNFASPPPSVLTFIRRYGKHTVTANFATAKFSAHDDDDSNNGIAKWCPRFMRTFSQSSQSG